MGTACAHMGGTWPASGGWRSLALLKLSRQPPLSVPPPQTIRRHERGRLRRCLVLGHLLLSHLSQRHFHLEATLPARNLPPYDGHDEDGQTDEDRGNDDARPAHEAIVSRDVHNGRGG